MTGAIVRQSGADRGFSAIASRRLLVGALALGVVAAAALAIGWTRAKPASAPKLAVGPHDWMPDLRRAAPAATAAPASACPDGMQLVEGTWCPYVGHRCVDWIEEHRDRCRRYDEKVLCEGLKVDKRFCIDRFEYPNQEGAFPVVMASWVEAQAACKAEGKRLCTESEWTFACEGVEQKPYPYGFTRDTQACNIDRHYYNPDFDAFSDDWRIAPEVARLDQRVASGSMARCESPFGVRDMTGNVDEWVVNEEPKEDSGEDVSGLKGGYWGPIRARCRPITNSHNRWFRFYQVGFRCCAEAH